MPQSPNRTRRPTGVVPSLSSTVTPISEDSEDAVTRRFYSSEDAPTVGLQGRETVPARAVGAAASKGDSNLDGVGEGDFDDGDEQRTDPWSIAREAASAKALDDSDVVDGRYRLERVLGQGGMARTFLASHVRLGKPFALKALHANLAEDPQMRDFFFHEAQLASQLDHPHIVQVTDYGDNDELGPYLVMELLIGQTLRKRMHGRLPFRVTRALDFALQVADAVQYMHGQGIIHRDIKPDNIFVCTSGRQVIRRPLLKLMDFGLARQEALGAQLSRTELIGTPVYMAPEQLMRAAPQASMDIYALGALLYELLTGRPPFTGSVDEVVQAKSERAPEPPSAQGMDYQSEAVDHLVLKALAQEPSHRHPSMAHFIFELRTVMAMVRLQADAEVLDDPEASLLGTTALEQGWLAFESCPFPQFTLTPKGRLLTGNPAFSAFLGCSVESLRGTRLTEGRLSRIYPTLAQDIQAAMVSGEPQPRDLHLELRDGTHTVLTVWLIPLRNAAGDSVSCAGLIVPQAA